MKQILLLLLLFGHSVLKSQTKIVFKPMNPDSLKNQFCFNLGVGYDDGLVFFKNNWIPAFGMSYERRLSKYVSLATHLLVYYRTAPDAYPLGASVGYPSLYQFRGANSPFMSQADKDKLAQSGLWTLDPNRVIKTLSVPIDIGITFYPLSLKQQRGILPDDIKAKNVVLRDFTHTPPLPGFPWDENSFAPIGLLPNRMPILILILLSNIYGMFGMKNKMIVESGWVLC